MTKIEAIFNSGNPIWKSLVVLRPQYIDAFVHNQVVNKVVVLQPILREHVYD